MLFSEVIGQKEIKKKLIKQVLSSKIPHALLFNGMSGYGSLPLALAYTQYVFCENKSQTDSCGECKSCKRVNELQHPDLHFSYPCVSTISKLSDYYLSDWREIVKQKKYFDLYDWIKKIDPKERKPFIYVEESQSIIKKLALKSFEGGYKIMLIWSIEEMNLHCSNKLLKILEEPQEKTIFILVSKSIETILPTIISRVQVVNVPRVEQEPFVRYLIKHQNMGEAPANSKYGYTQGDFLQLRDNELDANQFEQFVKLMRFCYKKDVIEMLKWAEEMSEYSKEQQKIFLQYSLHLFRQSILNNYQVEMDLQVSEKEKAFLSNFSIYITGKNIELYMNKFDKAYRDIDRNANTKILFSQLSFWVMRGIHKA